MVNQVLEATQLAFGTQELVSHLQLKNGRVHGVIEVRQSADFDRLDDVRRQQRLWDQLRVRLGTEVMHVGPIVLEPRNLG